MIFYEMPQPRFTSTERMGFLLQDSLFGEPEPLQIGSQDKNALVSKQDFLRAQFSLFLSSIIVSYSLFKSLSPLSQREKLYQLLPISNPDYSIFLKVFIFSSSFNPFSFFLSSQSKGQSFSKKLLFNLFFYDWFKTSIRSVKAEFTLVLSGEFYLHQLSRSDFYWRILWKEWIFLEMELWFAQRAEFYFQFVCQIGPKLAKYCRMKSSFYGVSVN